LESSRFARCCGSLRPYFLHKALLRDPAKRSARAQRDDALNAAIHRVWDANHQVYGPKKVWKALRRDGVRVARCTVARLMRAMGQSWPRCAPTWCSMHSNKPITTDARRASPTLCITATAAPSICRCALPTDWLTPASSRPSAAGAILMTTRSLESIIGLFKTEMIDRTGPRRHLEGAEFDTLTWVDWFTTRRLLDPIG
jgi:transposase InsO family protein